MYVQHEAVPPTLGYSDLTESWIVLMRIWGFDIKDP